MSSLLRLESKQKISSNVFRICIFLFSCSYSFEIETINTFVHSRSSPENHTRFQTIMGKSIPVFRPKRPKIHTLCGGTNLHGLYRGVQPPPPPPTCPGRARRAQMKYSQTSLYGRPLNTDSSLLRTVCFVPGEKKPLRFL